MIPTIDAAGLVAEESGAHDRVAEQIVSVFSTIGFAYVVNHGVDRAVIEDAFAASRRFHALPLAAKMAIEVNEFHRGYIPINTSTTTTSSVARVTRPNQSASLMIMHEVGSNDERIRANLALAGPNQWPAELPEIQAPLVAFQDALVRLARALVVAIETALGAHPGALLASFAQPTTFLRLLHYPPGASPSAEPDAELYGSAPHSDYGFLTLLAQDDVGGLQVRTGDGSWIDVPPRPGTFVLNTADMLHRWSNGRLISTPHRVLASRSAERYSLPFFFDPDVRTVVQPLSSCVPAGAAPSFEPVVYGDYLMYRLRRNHVQHGSDRPPDATD